MANQSLNELRNQVLARQRAAGQKISRAKRNGAQLAGTQYDPRVPRDRIKKYNARQLQSHLARLNTFVDRKTQFVGDYKGRPIPRQKWDKYKKAESAVNRRINEEFGRFAQIFLPSGETAAERMRRVTPDHKHMGNRTVNAPYAPPTRDPKFVKSEAALRKLTADMRRKMGKGWLDKEIERGRGEFNAMVDALNDTELKARVNALSRDRFYMLWNFTNFATNISLPYESAQAMLMGKKADYDEEVLADNLKDAKGWLKWAENVKIKR